MKIGWILAFMLLMSAEYVHAETACLTTLPDSPAFAPPAPYNTLPLPTGTFWYGTEALWTRLDSNGMWRMGNDLGGLVTKLVFWRRGEKNPTQT